MFVSRVHETASSSTLRSTGVVGGWLITTAAIGAFAFVAGNNVEQQTLGQGVTPANVVSVTTESVTTQPAIATTLTPALGGVVAHAKVTAAVVNATQGPGPHVAGCGPFRSAQRVGYTPVRERSAQSSNRRGPITLARAGDTSCWHEVSLSATTHEHVGSTPGAGQPGRTSFNTPR
jgi:hypothetical protein